MTTWFCVAPRLALSVIIPGVLLILGAYAALDRKPLDEYSAKPRTRKNVKYEMLSTTDESCDHNFTGFTRLTICWSILPLLIFLYWQYFVDYLSNHAVITTIAFQNSPFLPRDHYSYYISCDRIGKFCSSFFLVIFSCACPDHLGRVLTDRTWILALIGLSVHFVLVTASCFRFTPHVSIIMVLCFTEGLMAAAIYANSAYAIEDKFTSTRSREFGLSLLTLGVSAGEVAAGFMGMFIEPALLGHCLYALKLNEFCFTRFNTAKGWTENLHCNTKITTGAIIRIGGLNESSILT